MSQELTLEIEKNHAAFKLMKFSDHLKGKVAILQKGQLIEVMDTRGDAHKIAKAMLGENALYSIQEIHPRAIDLGARQGDLVRD